MTVSFRTALAAVAMLVLSFATSREANGQRPIDCMLVTQIPISECEALFSIFFSLNGTSWVSNRGWLLAGNVCEWEGVDCNTKEWPRNVTSLVIQDNDLSGSIPETIAMLPELHTLILNNTVGGGFFRRIGGTLPSSLASLEKLEVLDLSRNNIGGNLPGEYGNLLNLRVLNLDENQLEGPLFARLFDMAALEELNLSENLLSGSIPPEIEQLKRLKHLNLALNDFSGPVPDTWSALTAIQSVQLQNNRLSGFLPASLLEHESLLFLKASGNAFEGGLSPSTTSRLAQMNVCELENNTGGLCLPKTPLYGMVGVCNLEPRSDCSYCASLTDVSPNECTALERVFYETGGPEWTTRSGWFDTSSACTWFGVGCQDNAIVQLELPANNLIGRLPEPIADLPALATLDLSGNNLIGPVPLALVTRAAGGLACSLTDNNPGLCIPDTEPFRALGVEPICGLSLVSACMAPGAIRLISFTGRLSGQEIVVSWETSGSLPGIRYTVEQRTAESYISIGSVDAALNTTTESQYEFRFEPQGQTVITLRLRQRNPDGSESVSETIDILVDPEQRFLVMPPYPNPFSSLTELAIGVHEAERVHVTLYDALGRRAAVLLDEVLDAGAVRYITLEAAGLSDGVYMIRIQGEGFTTTRLAILRR